MENNVSLANNLMPGGSAYGGSERQGAMRVNNNHQNPRTVQQQHPSQPRQGLVSHTPMQDVFPLTEGQSLKCDRAISMADIDKVERAKYSTTDDEDLSSNGEVDPYKGMKLPRWQRVKWDSPMIKLLITACSYISDDAVLEGCPAGRRKYLNMLKKGKWKSISKAMAERGFFVSPQQCEDKFNDLNKRYKKLNDILGKGTTCQVVEKPALLDMMDHLSEQTKDEVRKLLSAKHLFYEELCSYHNNNRLHLPHDPALQQSLMLALKSRDDNDSDFRNHQCDDAIEDNDGADSDDHDEFEENWRKAAFALSGDPSKRMKQGFGLEGFDNRPQSTRGFSKGLQSQSQSPSADMHPAFAEGQNVASWRKQCLKLQALHLEEKRLQIEMETLELEKQRFKWHRFCHRKDRELERLKMENYRMKLENERMALEMKRMEMNQIRVDSKN